MSMSNILKQEIKPKHENDQAQVAKSKFSLGDEIRDHFTS